MFLLMMAVIAATPRPSVEGLDKPRQAQTGKLGKSELANGPVTIRCIDVGRAALVEIRDPGLKGAKDVWLRKKNGDSMPPCDANENGVTRVEGVAGFGYVLGAKGDFIFAESADGFGDRIGLRVFSASTGAMVLEVERSAQKPAALHAEGSSLWLRYHEPVPATCDPVGDDAAKCWKEVVESARIPGSVEVKPPPCGPHEKQLKAAPGSSQLAVPVEVDLSSPKTKRFRAGEATCGVAP